MIPLEYKMKKERFKKYAPWLALILAVISLGLPLGLLTSDDVLCATLILGGILTLSVVPEYMRIEDLIAHYQLRELTDDFLYSSKRVYQIADIPVDLFCLVIDHDLLDSDIEYALCRFEFEDDKITPLTDEDLPWLTEMMTPGYDGSDFKEFQRWLIEIILSTRHHLNKPELSDIDKHSAPADVA
jgi:hypothetical protein